MKITIFGATGKTGQFMLKQALERGYEVVAFVRSPQKITLHDPHLTVVQGELSEREKITSAIAGTDCVLSALGPTGNVAGDKQLSDGIANILIAMKECNVKRFIVLSTTSAQDPSDKDNLNFKSRRAMIRLSRPTTFEQIVKYSQLVRDSDTDWTLVRIASLLTNAPLSKHVHTGYLGRNKLKGKLSRANLAWYMLEQIKRTKDIRKAPAISD
ncbi:MAG TPA: NAD(P)H-binding protein [Ligilactobacillus acidipiscis]|uniref:NAD(P)H-binding protein n=1 Tax=Ligilactobacillus acidipiscis TaxID=89059 RepID=A0A921FB71_9LACO|nr:NAD(P)H-binding protein [Ligilactobacillus acidipiscis]